MEFYGDAKQPRTILPANNTHNPGIKGTGGQVPAGC